MTDKTRDIHPMLRPEDVALLDKLAGTEDLELAKLRDLVWKLSRLKVNEGYFPKYAALINPIMCNAYAVRLAEKLPVGDTKLTWNGGPYPLERYSLFKTTIECPPKDAVLLARPCFRISRNVSLETRNRLAELGKLRVTVSHLRVQDDLLKPETRVDDASHLIWEGSVQDFLADENGYGNQRQPTVLSPAPLEGIFSSGMLDDRQAAYPADLGVFLVSGTVVSLDLQCEILDGEGLEIHAGLVMARYTGVGVLGG